VFADVANAAPIDSVYDLTSVTAGDDVTVHAGSSAAVDLVLGLLTATDTVFLDTTGRVLDTADNGALDVVAFELDLRARGGVGTPDNPLETQVRRLHVLAGNGDLWITNPAGMESVTIDVALTRPQRPARWAASTS